MKIPALRALSGVGESDGRNALPSSAPPLFGRPVSKRIGVAARFVQVEFELQYLVLDVLRRRAWGVEVNYMTEHQQLCELVESARYLLQ